MSLIKQCTDRIMKRGLIRKTYKEPVTLEKILKNVREFLNGQGA